jgi:hypothetical protein
VSRGTRERELREKRRELSRLEGELEEARTEERQAVRANAEARARIDALDAKLRREMREEAVKYADLLYADNRFRNDQLDEAGMVAIDADIDAQLAKILPELERAPTPEEHAVLRKAFRAEVLARFKERLVGDGLVEGPPKDPLYPIPEPRLSEYQERLRELEARFESGEMTRAEYDAETNRMAPGIVGWKKGFAGLAPRWDDAALMAFGLESWNAVRARYEAKHGEPPGLQAMQDGTRFGVREMYTRSTPHKRLIAEAIGVFSVTWAQHAFQKLQTSHTYAAALMCSDASRDVLNDLELPWLAFMVHVPNGMLTLREDGKVVDFTRALVVSCPEPMQGEPGASLVLYDPNTESESRIVMHGGLSLGELLFAEPDALMGSDEDPSRLESNGPRVMRIFALAKRLVAGLVLAMQNADNFKARSVPARSSLKKRENPEPAHRVTVIGKPLRIDCRDSVRKYLDGTSRKHAPPSVQTLVRGHHKRQVMGVARSLRKVIWIEPYWRGPKDAPILTKPKKVG